MKHWYFSTFADLLTDVERELSAFLAAWPRRAPLFWSMVGHHFGWDGDAADTAARVNAGGKRIRPLLVAVVARALSGRHDHTLPAGVAIELIHNFTLVHDDVMDRSLERRHRETLWARWGMAQAINAGDGLYALGMSSLIRLTERGVPAARVLRAMDELLKACVATVEGQKLDVGFEERQDVTPADYLRMVAGKSGALIECSTRIGALLSTDDEATIDAYGEFGLSLGIAFQMWDDYLGIWGEAESTGKSVTGDIETRKKSYPILTAFERANAEQRRVLDGVYAKDIPGAEDIRAVLAVLDQVGAAEATQRLIEDYFNRALAALDSVAVDNDDQRRLRELALFLVERAY